MMSKNACLDQRLHELLEQQYLAATEPVSGTVKHALKKLAITTPDALDRICGVAQRVGYTGAEETDLAIYRLKIKHPTGRMPITLSGFFILEQGIFHEYDLSCEEDAKATEQEPIAV